MLGGHKILICVWKVSARVTALRKIPVKCSTRTWISTNGTSPLKQNENTLLIHFPLMKIHSSTASVFMLWPQMTAGCWPIHLSFCLKVALRRGFSCRFNAGWRPQPLLPNYSSPLRKYRCGCQPAVYWLCAPGRLFTLCALQFLHS